jgi:hypothetical protein
MGVPEYWLLDLELGRLDIRRGPTPDGLYTSTEILSDDARATARTRAIDRGQRPVGVAAGGTRSKPHSSV